MSLAVPPDTVRTIPGLEVRRSTRIERAVPLMIAGQTRLGLSFQEKTSAVSINLHGCRYPSRHEYSVGTWIGLQVMEPEGDANSPVLRALVRSIHPPANPRELFQIGVELETPANIWGIPAPPEDWLRLTGTNVSTTHLATGVAPAREPSATAPTLPQTQPEEAQKGAEAPALPSMPPAAPRRELATQSIVAKPERVTITLDQLAMALQGKLQQAAEKAVQNALSQQLDEAVKKAVCRIEEISRTNALQMEEHTAQRLETLVRSSREEVLSHLGARLEEVRSRWEEQQDAQRSRTEEVAQRLETLVADTQRDLAEAQKFVQKIARELEPQMRARLDDSLGRAIEELEGAAARVSDRQLIRLTEATQMAMREASAQLEARAAEARALVESAASGAFGEFRRQAEVQADLAISETTERIKSSLASLDAENRAACDARRRTMESDVTRATEQSTEQFRSGIKAFLYSCLVAAVGAVDEHAQTTLNGLVKNQDKAPHEIGGPSGNSEKDEHAV